PAIFFYYSTLSDSRFKTLQQNHFFNELLIDPKYLSFLNETQPSCVSFEGITQSHVALSRIGFLLGYFFLYRF
ncbi:hypothetical protein, partial [Enterococcus hirae]|uniref:hypothetical protein n=1 Tax=Enterococcus hirae TaxID=1354 RepID=UPI001A920E40